MKHKHDHNWNAIEKDACSDINYLINEILELKTVDLIIECSYDVSYAESEENCPQGAYLFVKVCFFNPR